MGEQSAGKSFTLDHLMGTSFASSAMHRTGLFLPVYDSESIKLIVLRGSVDVRVTYRR